MTTAQHPAAMTSAKAAVFGGQELVRWQGSIHAFYVAASYASRQYFLALGSFWNS
jgi:hypothetical protein